MACADYVFRDSLSHVLAALTPPNALAIEVSAHTGLRISDVLSLRTQALKQRMRVRELKTGKSKRIYLPNELYNRMIQQAGKIWVFSGRISQRKHRTRQAVWKDVKRASKAFRMAANVTPHSARKFYAVEEFKRTGDLAAVQRMLNHSDPTVTAIYAMADVLTERRMGKRKRKSAL